MPNWWLNMDMHVLNVPKSLHKMKACDAIWTGELVVSRLSFVAVMTCQLVHTKSVSFSTCRIIFIWNSINIYELKYTYIYFQVEIINYCLLVKMSFMCNFVNRTIHIPRIKFTGTFCEIASMWTQQNTFDNGKLIMIQVMVWFQCHHMNQVRVWCRQASSYELVLKTVCDAILDNEIKATQVLSINQTGIGYTLDVYVDSSFAGDTTLICLYISNLMLCYCSNMNALQFWKWMIVVPPGVVVRPEIQNDSNKGVAFSIQFQVYTTQVHIASCAAELSTLTQFFIFLNFLPTLSSLQDGYYLGQ